MKRNRRKGFMMLDVLAGLSLLAALASALAVMSHSRYRTAAQLQHQRAAVQVAQEVLANLQSTGQAASSDPTAKVTVQRSGQNVGDMEWVNVTVVIDNRRAHLVGLVRGNAGEGK